MMNPIFKSKQTINSLQMHRFTGVPWRGGGQFNRDLAVMGEEQSNQQFDNTFREDNLESAPFFPD